MEEFAGKVAVVTGAASGIGRALAERFAAEGMKVVLADVEEDALQHAAAAIRASGAEVLAVRTDVSRVADLRTLAERALAAFGAVHLLCNNAGVFGPPKTAWEQSDADWEWTLGVNLYGVLHGMQVFVPLMLAQGGDAHIVNTASEAAFTVRPFTGAYNASKHAVNLVSETAAVELKLRGAAIVIHSLCPGGVNTRVWDAARNRPAHLADDAPLPPEGQRLFDSTRTGLAGAMDPREVASVVLEAIRTHRFYVFSHPELKSGFQRRFEQAMAEGEPYVSPRLLERLGG